LLIGFKIAKIENRRDPGEIRGLEEKGDLDWSTERRQGKMEGNVNPRGKWIVSQPRQG